MPPAYLIVHAKISDEVQYAKYRTAVVPLIAEFGGEHIARGGSTELLEGPPDSGRPVIFEFPSLEAIHAFLALAGVCLRKET